MNMGIKFEDGDIATQVVCKAEIRKRRCDGVVTKEWLQRCSHLFFLQEFNCKNRKYLYRLEVPL